MSISNQSRYISISCNKDFTHHGATKYLLFTGDITVQGVDKERQLETGEIIIIVAVLLMWAAVIALFCRQYDIIKDNDSNNNKEKAKASSEQSTPERQASGLLRKVIGSGYCIRGQDVGMQWEWGLGASWIGSLLLYKIKGCE
uniref:Fibronectin type III domain-containing protein n=1 Tax=Leptobrachium leishanense TaxID=445787 RepID=A0A8C5QE02_9ANUR